MRILIADDDPDFRGLAARAMRREFPGAEILEAGDPATLDQAMRTPPGLLVSDLELNWTTGFDILERVRTVAPGCPAVMFTGTGSEEVAVRAIKAGFDDYVVKSARQLQRLAAAARAAVTRAETRRGLEENRDLLTQELYHRLHNNLQLMVGLISFTARAIADADARTKLEDLGRRVQSLSLLQERLYRGGDFRRVDFADFLGQLVDDLLGLDSRGVTASVEVEATPLPVDLAVPLALVANELITNSLQHARFAEGEGRLGVRFHRIDADRFRLEISDNGNGKQPAEPKGGSGGSGGLGMRLVHRLVQQVGGEMETGGASLPGTTWRITVPTRGIGP
ncbi:histidine kinase dimerization/phosphoacceptor domain -containing protein [Muricoccus aerilatus]|uniref:histidine kinase dimerization/phosphoacceptor domain -containing protein n=1 Tax=Muricoccus aerilatus TaxID=452982 RepID=UPI000694AB69|nr:histidine kinase dimerization/phosphoacceptor domain -containing protein [Roseomonas aerilata]